MDAYSLSPEIENTMRMFFDWLSEKDRRRMLPSRPPTGSRRIDYISSLLACDPETIRQGQQDLDQLRDRREPESEKGGGPKLTDTIPAPGSQLSANCSRIAPQATRCGRRSAGRT